MYQPIIFINLMVTVGVLYADKIYEQISIIVDLRAVTDFAELEDLYRDLYEKNKDIQPWVPISKKLRRRVKKKLCKKIFDSTFYDMQGEDWLHPNDPNNRQKIENLFPNTSTYIYEWLMPNILSRVEKKCTNRYREQPIYLSDRIPRNEHLFSCFTMDRESGNISHYLVSREYNVTEDMINAYPMAARFVFGFDERNELSLIAMAEESALGHAIVDKTSVAEIYYVGFREHTTTSETIAQDPVCKLSRSHKLRLCASVFASKIFRIKKIKFKPLISNVEEQCVRREVSLLADISKRRRFLLKVTRRHFKRDKIYEEWMFACQVSDPAATSSNGESLYYVSRGDLPHTVFLYFEKFSNDRLYVVNYLKNVSVVDTSRDDFDTSTTLFETPPKFDYEERDDVVDDIVEDVAPSLSKSRSRKINRERTAYPSTDTHF